MEEVGLCGSPELLWRAALPRLPLPLFFVFVRNWPACQPLAAALGCSSPQQHPANVINAACDTAQARRQRAEPLQTRAANGLY